MDVEKKIMELTGKVEAVVDILSNRQTNDLDGERIKSFINNYAFLNAIIKDENINSMIQNISIVKNKLKKAQDKIEGILGAIDVETEKLAESLAEGASSLALSAANNALFQASVFDANKSMLQHLADLDITGKLQRMDAALSEAIGLIANLRDQRDQINILFQKVQENKELIEGQDEVNKQQQDLINESQTLVVELEKQIENYAFFAEEFDKIYTTAKDFISSFSELLTDMEYIKNRDGKLEQLLSQATSVYTEDIASMDEVIDSIKTTVNNFGMMTAQKIDDMALFINEFKALNVELDAFKDDTSAIRTTVSNAMDRLNSADMMF